MIRLMILLFLVLQIPSALSCDKTLRKLVRSSFGNEVSSPRFNDYIGQIKGEHQGAFDYYSRSISHWDVPGSLSSKIASDGKLSPYHGNTVVFPLVDFEKGKIDYIQRKVRELFPFLGQKLSKDDFHLTLHDLFHAKTMEEVKSRINSSTPRVRDLFNEVAQAINEKPSLRFIEMRPSMVLPSVNTSMVISYLPATKADHDKLFGLYKIFDSITVLPYMLRAHVTLDYFRPVSLSLTELNSLKNMVTEVNQLKLPTLKLDVLELSYQLFYDMDDYRTMFKVKY